MRLNPTEGNARGLGRDLRASTENGAPEQGEHSTFHRFGSGWGEHKGSHLPASFPFHNEHVSIC